MALIKHPRGSEFADYGDYYLDCRGTMWRRRENNDSGTERWERVTDPVWIKAIHDELGPTAVAIATNTTYGDF